jgi:hypothetical protein
MIITIQRRGRAVRILADGGRVGDFRSEQAGLEFARRLFGYVIVQQEFNFSGGGAGKLPPL